MSEKIYIFDNNRITRPYIGGTLLNKWRKMTSIENGHNCEELLVTSIGAISKGKPKGYAISKTIPTQGNRALNDLLHEEPERILGKNYLDDENLKVLARVGDTVVRLVLQCHPRKADAQHYFNEKVGKSEAWYIARTQEVNGQKSCVYAGFKDYVTKDLWAKLCKQQDVEKMVDCLYKIDVKEGDVVMIPAGMPHAVGPGCLFLEIHECSDITIRVERNINGVELTDEEMFYGLDFEHGMELFDYTTYSSEEIIAKVIMKPKKTITQDESKLTWMIDQTITDAFYMCLVDVKGQFVLPYFDGHQIIIPVENDIEVMADDQTVNITQGWGALITADSNEVTIKADDAKVMIGLPTRKVGEI